MLKKVVSVLMCTIIIVLSLPTYVYASISTTYSGKCNDSVSWRIDTEDKVLTISGIGDIPNYGIFNQPWYAYRDYFNRVEITEGITRLGSDAFNEIRTFNTIVLPKTLQSIGDRAFQYATGMNNIYIPLNCTSMGFCAFNYCWGLKDVYYEGTESQFNAISKSYAGIGGFSDLFDATKHYNYSYGDVIDYSNLDINKLTATSWSNLGIDNFNNYLSTALSISETVKHSYEYDKTFLNDLCAWQAIHLTFEPGDIASDLYSLKTYYQNVLFSILNDKILSDNYADTIESSVHMDELKITAQVEKLIKSCSELDYNKIVNSGTISDNERIVLSQKISTLEKQSEAISIFGDVIGHCSSLNDSINTCVNYINLSQANKSIVNVLNKMKTYSEDIFYSNAISEVIDSVNSGFQAVLLGVKNGVDNYAVKNISDLVNDSWSKVLTSNPITNGALIGYKIGKPLTNFLFKTEKTFSNYYDFYALYFVEKSIKSAIKDFENEFYANVDETTSMNYINAVSLYFEVTYLSCDFAIDLDDIVYNSPFGIFKRVITGGKKTFADKKAEWKKTKSSVKNLETTLYRLWAYSLKSEYPTVYNDISGSVSDLFGTNLSNANVRVEYLNTDYTGVEKCPSATVIANGTALIEGIDYTLSYSNNVNPGIATVTVSPCEGSIYTGQKSTTFVINEIPFKKQYSIWNGRKTTVFARKLMSATTTQTIPSNTNVKVYDNGTIVACVENGVVTCEEIPVIISDYGIDILMYDKDYVVEVTDTDESKVSNSEVLTFDSESNIVNSTYFNSISSQSDETMVFNLSSENTLSINDETIDPTLETSTVDTDIKSFNITANNAVSSKETAYAGERVVISAVLPSGYDFVEWVSDDNIEFIDSSNSTTSFIMPESDVTINAVIEYSDAKYVEDLSEKIKTEMLSGAAMRLNEPTGLRFYTRVDSDVIAELREAGVSVKMGTLIAPEDLLDGEELTFDLSEDKYVNVVYDSTNYYTEGDFSGIVGSIVNIKDANASREFVGRGYVTIEYQGETRTVYADYAESNIENNMRSIGYIAKQIQTDTEYYTSLTQLHKEVVDKYVGLYSPKVDDPYGNDIW